jgi:hypothetical protein
MIAMAICFVGSIVAREMAGKMPVGFVRGWCRGTGAAMLVGGLAFLFLSVKP